MLSDKQALDLDRKIAEKVFGLKVVVDLNTYRGVAIREAGPRDEDLPKYSTQMEEAMQVWDHVRKNGARWLLNVDMEGFHLRRVAWITHNGEKDEKDFMADKPLGWAKKIEDLPKVICNAALNELNRSIKEFVKKAFREVT